ncbi:MAG: Fur family transcriptional regulator [Nitrospinota bacterium]
MHEEPRNIKGTFHKKGLKITKQRQVILQALKDTHSHPSADWLYDRVKAKIPNVSLGTIYRNLQLMKEHNFIRKVDAGSGIGRFDGNPSPHSHVICLRCGEIKDLDIECPKDLDEQAARLSGYKVLPEGLEFKGYCPNCRAKEMEEEKLTSLGSSR